MTDAVWSMMVSLGLICTGAAICVKATGGTDRPLGAEKASHWTDKDLARLMNGLCIGCTEEGTLAFLLDRARRLDMIYGGLGYPETAASKKYDSVRVLRVGADDPDEWLPGRLYLYFREGHLAYKCIVPSSERADEATVFRREILSGLQHPPFFPGLMDKVAWGKEKRIDHLVKSKSGKPPPPSRVRCGILLRGLPPFAQKYGYNCLCLYQNVGPARFDEHIYLLSFPFGPVVFIGGDYKDKELVGGATIAPGLYGTKVESVDRGSAENEHRAHTAEWVLDPKETVYFWARLEKPDSFKSIRAEFAGIGIVGTDFSCDAESPSVEP